MYGQFLLGRQGLYYFRKRIPQKLVHILNKREIKLSLKTSNKKKAKIIASQLLVNVEMGLIDLNNSKREHVLTDFQRLINHLRDTIKLFHNSKNIAPLNLIYAQTTKTETIKQIGYDEAFTLYENLTNDSKATRDITKRSVNLIEKIYPYKAFSELKIQDAMRARNEMAYIPSDYYRFKTAKEAKQNSNKEGLNPKTINRHIQKLKNVFDLLIKSKTLPTDENPFKIEKAKGGAHTTDDRHPLSKEQITKLFDSPIYKGCLSTHSRFKDGDLFIQDGYYWLILIALFTGARANEICQLSPDDIKTHILDNGEIIYYFDIHDEGLRKLKTKSSKRKIPLHHRLLSLGLLEYISFRKQEGHNKLLSISKYSAKTKTYSVYASKRFSVLLEAIGAKTAKTSLHSTRHNFKDILTEYNVDYEIKKQLLGHASTDVTTQYGSGASLVKLNEAINKIDYSFIDFSEIKAIYKQV